MNNVSKDFSSKQLEDLAKVAEPYARLGFYQKDFANIVQNNQELQEKFDELLLENPDWMNDVKTNHKLFFEICKMSNYFGKEYKAEFPRVKISYYKKEKQNPMIIIEV